MLGHHAHDLRVCMHVRWRDRYALTSSLTWFVTKCQPYTHVHRVCLQVEKFIPAGILRVLQYAGQPGDRRRLQPLLTQHTLVVTSYDVLRSDADVLGALTWRF